MGAVINLVYAFVAVAAAVNLVNLIVGLLSAVTGRSHAPRALGRLRRDVAASPDDQRLLGMTLVLLSAGQLAMLASLTIVVTLAAAQASGGRAPILGLYLATSIGFLCSVACTYGSFALGRRVRYAAGGDGADAGRGARKVSAD